MAWVTPSIIAVLAGSSILTLAYFLSMQRRVFFGKETPEMSAVREAPPGCRAHVRGRCIRDFARQNDRYVCSWDAIFDRTPSHVAPADLARYFGAEPPGPGVSKGVLPSGRAA